jgi:hypothetical protein
MRAPRGDALLNQSLTKTIETSRVVASFVVRDGAPGYLA